MKSRERVGREFEPKETLESRVIIDFFRHGKKEKDPKKANKDLQLTIEGIRQAREKGKDIHPQPEVSIAGGSPKDRARDTGLRIMLADRDEISDDMSMKEIEAFISNEIGSNLSKVIEIEGLDYESTDSPLPPEGFESVRQGRYLEWVLTESRELSEQRGDSGGYTQDSHAAAVAGIIKKYMKVANTFSRIVENDQNKYTNYGNQLERYFGTHQAVQESFVVKLLEKKLGIEAREEFLAEVGNSGFDELEGIRVEIVNHNGQQNISVEVKLNEKKWNVEIDPEILDEIIGEHKGR